MFQHQKVGKPLPKYQQMVKDSHIDSSSIFIYDLI